MRKAFLNRLVKWEKVCAIALILSEVAEDGRTMADDEPAFGRRPALRAC
jgi:hypothetical protein